MKHKPLFLIISLVLIVKILFLMNTYHLPSWDESVFLGMGKWISSSGNVGLWEEIRPPGLPIMLGLIEQMGLNYIIFSEILMISFTLGVLTLTYLICLRLFNIRTAIIASILTFITPTIFHYSGRIMTGIPALFFCLLALYLFMTKSYTLSALSCFLAFLFRYPAGLIYPIIAILILTSFYDKRIIQVWENIKNNYSPLMKFNLTFILLLIVFFTVNKIVYGSFLEPLILASKHQSTFTGNIQGVSYILFYPVVLVSSNLFFLFAAFTPKKKNIHYIIIPLAVFFIYFTIIPHKKERFLILLVPYISVLTAHGIQRLLNIRRDIYYKLAIFFVLFMLLIPTSINSYLATSYIPKQEPDFVEHYYNFIDKKINGSILTSDPVPTAYTDNQYIHFYDDPEKGLEILKENIDSVDAVIYYEEAFPWNSTIHENQKDEMKRLIMQKATLLKNASVWGTSREIYIVN